MPSPTQISAHLDRQARVKELTEAGFSTRQIAEALQISTRAVTRNRARAACSRKVPPPLSPEARQWVREARADGMPSTWVAETVGCNVSSVGKTAPLGAELAREWRQIWQQIRRNPVLLALHHEFAPPAVTYSPSRRAA